MQPELIHQATAIRVAGLQIRTSNADELLPAQGKIGLLWNNFREQRVWATVPGADTESPVYGVYTGYETDHNGFYDLTAGVRLQDAAVSPAGWSVVTVTPGDYLVFEASGPMPQCVIAAWQQVWAYFAADGAQPAYERSYTSDFEECTSDTAVRLHIAIKPR